MRRLLLLGCLLAAGSAWAQPMPLQYGPGAPSLATQTTTFTGSGTWTPPAGMKFFTVTAQGQGGCGGAGTGIAAGGSGSGGGGGGGGASKTTLKPILASQVSGSATITIAAQCTAAAAGASGKCRR